MDSRHLSDLGQLRERTAVIRWMLGHARDLVRKMGLEKGWWCGINLPRRGIFGGNEQGDVDLIAGPLSYTFSDEELAERIRKALLVDVFGEYRAHHEAGMAGCVDWPPRVEHVVACEVKASYFDGAGWKATHIGERARVLGQLDLLRERGVNRVSFLHLGSTTPRGETDVREIARELDAAAWPTFPQVFRPEEHPDYGYFRAMMGAQEGMTEEFSGVHDGLVVSQLPRIFERGPQAWHGELARRLAELPRPTCWSVFVVSCEQCGRWRHALNTREVESSCSCASS